MSESEGAQDQQQEFRIPDDQLQEITDRLADRFAGVFQGQSGQSGQSGQGGQQSDDDDYLNDIPAIRKLRADLVNQQQTMMAPLMHRSILEAAQSSLAEASHLGAEGMAVFQDVLSKMDPAQVNQVATNPDSITLLAKAIAYDQLVAGKVQFQGQHGFPGSAQGTTPSHMDGLSEAIRQEISNAEQIRGKPYTREELQAHGYLDA